jgi:hypothetical protein
MHFTLIHQIQDVKRETEDDETKQASRVFEKNGEEHEHSTFSAPAH